MFKICKNMHKKVVLFKQEFAKSWTNLTTNQFGLKEKNIQIHINPSPNNN